MAETQTSRDDVCHKASNLWDKGFFAFRVKSEAKLIRRQIDLFTFQLSLVLSRHTHTHTQFSVAVVSLTDFSIVYMVQFMRYS